MDIEEMHQRKRELGLTYQEISDASGVPLATVQKILTGVTKDPRDYSKSRIEAVLSPDFLIKEDIVEWGNAAKKFPKKAQGEYVVDDDYYNLPEDERCEIIEGVIYDMGAPTLAHQEYSYEICSQINDYIKVRKGSCKAFVSPVDVKLSENTVVQPDVLVLCSKDKHKGKRIEGAPDMVVEITSISSRTYDKDIKFKTYMNAGVREYWIIDLQDKTVNTFFRLESGKIELGIYSLLDIIPVGIFDSECTVDFKAITDNIW